MITQRWRPPTACPVSEGRRVVGRVVRCSRRRGFGWGRRAGWFGAVVVGPGGVLVSGGGGPGQGAVGVGLHLPARGVGFQQVVVGAVGGEVVFAGRAAVGPGEDVVQLGVGGFSAAAGESAV